MVPFYDMRRQRFDRFLAPVLVGLVGLLAAGCQLGQEGLQVETFGLADLCQRLFAATTEINPSLFKQPCRARHLGRDLAYAALRPLLCSCRQAGSHNPILPLYGRRWAE